MNPWAVPVGSTAMAVDVPDVQMRDVEERGREKGKEKEMSPASDLSDWYF